MTKKAMVEELKAKGFLKKERVTAAVWNGTASKEHIERIYKTCMNK